MLYICGRNSTPRDVCMSSAWVADIFKRRLLTLCSGVFETSQLSKASSGLSNDRCPTGYRLSFMCLLWYGICVYTYAHARTLTIVARRVFIFGVGFALSFYQERQCESLIEWNGNSRTPRFLFYAYT